MGESTPASLGPVPEAPMRTNELGGKVPEGPGWYVLNVDEAEWHSDGRSGVCAFEGPAAQFQQYGSNIHVLEPGEPNAVYHREYYEDESFFVLSGTCTLVIEGEQRTLRAGDFFWCPAGTGHVLVGAGETRCAIFMLGARNKVPAGEQWGVYPAEPAAAELGASSAETTADNKIAYAGNPPFAPVAEPWWTPG